MSSSTYDSGRSTLKHIQSIGMAGHVLVCLCILYVVLVGCLGMVAIFTKDFPTVGMQGGITGLWGLSIWNPSVIASGSVTSQVLRHLVGLLWSVLGLYCMDCVFDSFRKGELFCKSVHQGIFFFGCWCLTLGEGPSLSWILVGLFLMAIGWVMRLATALKEEQSLTI